MDSMNILKRLVLCAAVLCVFLSAVSLFPARAESADPSAWWRIDRTPRAGDRSVTLRFRTDVPDLQAGVFSGGEALCASVTADGRSAVISLSRPLREGESLLVAAEGGKGFPRSERDVTVLPVLGCRLVALRERADRMWDTWTALLQTCLEQGIIPVPPVWLYVPFVTWADEAPEIAVLEEDGQARIYLDREETAGWTVSVQSGLPAETVPCEWDGEAGCYTANGPFDSVYIESEATPSSIGVSVTYERTDEFRPSCPVLLWEGETGDGRVGLGCYGWGTTRSFQGGMYILAIPGYTIYAEYSPEGALLQCTDLMTDCVYSPEGLLLSGDEPEGYTWPVVTE